MTNIFCRSPHIIAVNDISQTGSKIELFIYDGSATVPSTPTYTLSKLIPASNNTDTSYNISPYLREYITHLNFNNNYDVNNSLTPYAEWSFVKVVSYSMIGGSYILDRDETYRVFDGYGYYEDGGNPDLGDILLAEGTYNYWFDTANSPSTIPAHSAGIVTAYLPRNYTVYYHNLSSGGIHTISIPQNEVYDLYRVFPTWYGAGNRMEIYDGLNNLVWTSTFLPKTECRYEPLNIDFINKYGAWQTEFFYKASFENLEVTNTAYNLAQTAGYYYNQREGQRAVFNANGLRKYRMNTGFVDESYNETIQQLLLSERVIWSDGIKQRPIKINTKGIEKHKNINNKTINYTIEFELAYDVINSVI
jgi:hypothetical protein